AKESIELAVKESCLVPYQLERIEKALVVTGRLKSYLERGKQYGNSLAYYEVNLDPMEELREEIARQIRGGEVDDYASKLLQEIRRDISNLEEKMKQKAEQIMRSNKECMADHFFTLRNGRVCIPVKKEYKWKIPGSTVDKSSTGNTLFVEPVSISNMYEEVQLLKIEEENEVHRILYTLTAMAAEGATVIQENMRMIEKLDFIFSKGKLSMDMEGVEPRINTQRKIRLCKARHPLMEKDICVPLDFEMGEGIRGVVITGPNTGGKTVSIKTAALCCLMAQYGLHVPCKEADICMNSLYLCDIGDGQNITENLSTFSAHIKNALEIIREVDAESLVVMDELGSGTDPAEGMGIAVAILEQLRKSGCLFLATTHYPEVKEYADRAEGVLNARMEFDRETLKPTYRMIMGEAGESCAFFIARKLGMPPEMLKTAMQAAYGKGDSNKAWENAEPAPFLLAGETDEQSLRKASKIKKHKEVKKSEDLSEKYRIGDSVMIYPEKKIGIVCVPVNEKGVLRVQLPNKKIWINHKRVKLHVAAKELYPEDYDFSIVFDTVENRKTRHDMERKYTERIVEYE
ncbi:MAG: DNA mismatch repair protein MutS, partial [Lachnospiraceae bacterium]|nr:DNA mismatch repair protein MutS [Lachnospiraceae bacterium]